MVDLDQLEEAAAKVTPRVWSVEYIEFASLASPSTVLKLVAVARAANEALLYIHCSCKSQRAEDCPRCCLRDTILALEEK